MVDVSEQLDGLRHELETLQRTLEQGQAARDSEIAIEALREQIGSLELQIGAAGGISIEGDVDTGGGDFITGDKTVEAADGGVAIGGDVRDATIITGDTYGDLHIYQGIQPLEIPAPPRPQALQTIENFVGRQDELAYFAEKLGSERLAVICGMPGVGKSWLAIQLARKTFPPEKIFWHAFHEGDGIETIIWKLAAFLAWHGTDDLWKTLQSVQLIGGKTPPPEVLFDYLFQLLADKDYLLCLDDFHFVEDDPHLDAFLSGLENSLGGSKNAAIITTHKFPAFLSTTEHLSLSGLGLEECRQILEGHQVQLAEVLLEALHTQTNGNPQLICLAINSLRHDRDPGSLINRLIEADDIERFLINEVDDGLDDGARETMTGVAVLLGYPGLREAIEATLDRGGLRRLLRELTDRFLLNVQEGVEGREYYQAKIIQSFYYDLLGRRERRSLHGNAGDYYEVDEPDIFRAALHYQRAGEDERAAQLASSNVRMLLNQGYGKPLQNLLDQFAPQQLTRIHWAKIIMAKGFILGHMGEHLDAQNHYREAFILVEELLASPETQELRGSICLRLADLLRYRSTQEALSWCQKGINIVGNSSSELSAALSIMMSSILCYQGDVKGAQVALDLGKTNLPASPNFLHIDSLLVQGNVYSCQGKIKEGLAYSQYALELSQQLNDNFRMVSVLTNLSLDKFSNGDWPGGIADSQRALTLAEQLGNLTQRIRLTLNTGWMLVQIGSDDDSAENRLRSAANLAQMHNMRGLEMFSLSNLSDLYIRQGKIAEARSALVAAEQLAEQMGVNSEDAEMHCNFGRICLAEGKLVEARRHILAAIDAAREINSKYQEGLALRVLGQIQGGEGQREIALASFDASLDLLRDDPYESARTLLEKGLLLSNDAPGNGRDLLKSAQATFERLGAMRDLALVRRTFEGLP